MKKCLSLIFLAGSIFVHFIYTNSYSEEKNGQRPHSKRTSIDTLKKQQIALRIDSKTAGLSASKPPPAD